MNIAEAIFDSLSTGLCERGNTSLRNNETGDAIFFHEVAEGVWLEVVHISENYPAWTVQTVNKSKQKIITHIEENFSDPWVLEKNNIGANTYNDFSPITMSEVLERVETDLYRNKPMTTTKEIRNALTAILKNHDWTIAPVEADKLVDEYYDSK